MRTAHLVTALVLAVFPTFPAGAQREAVCAPVVAVATHDGTTTRYALHGPHLRDGGVSLVLLPGGGGFLDLDADGCPRRLSGNSLVRSIPHFISAGFTVALVDAPSDHRDEDGLAAFRTDPKHASDIGRVIVDLRRRVPGAVWLAGTSRGSISAANAAVRLEGPEAPDGVVLTSALMAGQIGARKLFVAQSVFDLPLEAIRQPVLIVGHAADQCIRSPPGLMSRLAERLSGTRAQVVTVEGGPTHQGAAGIEACEGRSPHGFVGQEAEVAAGIVRFVRTGRY